MILAKDKYVVNGRVRVCTLVPYAFEGISTWLGRLDRFAYVVERTAGPTAERTRGDR